MGEMFLSPDYFPCLGGHEQNLSAFLKIGGGVDIAVVKQWGNENLAET